MLLTLSLVVLFAAIVVFFSQEFIRMFKKIFAIQGAKIFIPLTLASWCVFEFNPWVLWAMYYCREKLHSILSFLTHLMPFQKGASSLALIVLLTVISVVPVLLLDILARKNTYKPYRYPYITSTIIWLAAFVLLVIL